MSKYLNWNNRYSVYLNPLKSELQLLFHSIRAHKKLYQKLQKSNAYAMNVMKKQVENLHSLDYQLQEENKQLDWNGLIEVKKRLVSVMNERLLDLERSAKGGNNQYAMYAEEVLVPVSPEQ